MARTMSTPIKRAARNTKIMQPRGSEDPIPKPPALPKLTCYHRVLSTLDKASRCPLPERVLAHVGAADGHPGDERGRDADAHGHGLAVLAAGPAAVAELEVVADGADFGEHVGAIA